MKGEETIMTIRVLSHQKLSQRTIAKLLKISPTTVNRYAKKNDTDEDNLPKSEKKKSAFEPHTEYLIERLTEYPNLRSSRLYIEVLKIDPELKTKERAFRTFVLKLKQEHRLFKQKQRYYCSVIDNVLGFQVQVDPGEMLVDLKSGAKQKIYFVAFVLSYSRAKYVCIQDHPINTFEFIEFHKQAFEYFGGVPQTIVYDQTKLVCICEKYREVWLNTKFEQFAKKSSFHPIVCEGYDPESKGKVERVVQEIKAGYLYGTKFLDLSEIKEKSLDWLEMVNSRQHPKEKRSVLEMWQEEKSALKPASFSPCLNVDIRLVDKVGYLSFEGNKYSAPYLYQKKYVKVKKRDNSIFIFDIDKDIIIAQHQMSIEKGTFIRDNSHYKNLTEELERLIAEAKTMYLSINHSDLLIEKVLNDNQNIKTAQIRGLKKIKMNFSDQLWQDNIEVLLSFSSLSVSKIESFLKQAEQQEKADTHIALNNNKIGTSLILRNLKEYRKLVQND